MVGDATEGWPYHSGWALFVCACVSAPEPVVSPHRLEGLIMAGAINVDEPVLTPEEVAERLRIDGKTVRRLFLDEPGVIVICFPRKGKRVYRTLRIPASVFQRVVTRLARVA